jgi:hypothetical protein
MLNYSFASTTNKLESSLPSSSSSSIFLVLAVEEVEFEAARISSGKSNARLPI